MCIPTGRFLLISRIVTLIYKQLGLGGFPLGDLNWFPTQKATWLQQSATEYADIQKALDGGTVVPTAVQDHVNVHATFALEQNYPDPFNPSTVISYQLPVSSIVTIKVYDMLGREVRTLVNERESTGNHSVRFDAASLASGVYFYRLEAGSYHDTKKLLLLK